MRINRLAFEESAALRSPLRAWVIRGSLLGLALAALIAVGGNHWPARAQTNRFVIAMGGDDNPGFVNDCTSPDQPCATIQHAIDQSSTGDLIVLGPGSYFEHVTVTADVTIQGDGSQGSTVDGSLTGTVVTVNPAVTATLNSLTITNGTAQAATNTSGGGIFNSGSLTVIGSTITGNQAANGAMGNDGGGIFNSGTLTVINSTISGNLAGAGGGIFNAATDTATVVNSTINGNSAVTGGGIVNDGALNLTNTIISGSLGGGADCVSSGTVPTNVNNLIQDGACSPAVSGDPKLGPLQNNGGPTFTHELLAGSPAINAGDDSVLGSPLFLETDQRGIGFPRKTCTHVDIGAFEFGGGVAPTINCPGDVTVFAPSGQTTASVSFSVTASDLCDGPLTPSCQTGAGTPITSPFDFPLGVTSVICSAMNSAGVTAMCSFSVSVIPLNMCIQDDHTGDTFQFNSQTGGYVYTRCRDNFTLTGTGSVFNFSGIVMLSDSRPDRRINAGFNLNQLTGRANITLILGPGINQTITVFQTNPHPTCSCR